MLTVTVAKLNLSLVAPCAFPPAPVLLLVPLTLQCNADHERKVRTNVASRATSSLTIRPFCTTGCLQSGQGGAVARGMKTPKQPLCRVSEPPKAHVPLR